MTTFTKSVIAVIAAVVITLAIYGAYQYPHQLVATGSPSGSTFGTMKFAGIVWLPNTGATTTSILNSDASDRLITKFDGTCTGVTSSFTAITGAGLASLTLKAATTSTNAPAIVTNGNFVLNATISTSTAVFALSSTTMLLAGDATTTVWKTGSYLSLWTNATSSATCTVGVEYIGS